MRVTEIQLLTNPYSSRQKGANVTFTNDSNKTIKYATFQFAPINAVDDYVSCEIKGKTMMRCQYTGPIYPGETASVGADDLWFNSTIRSVCLEGVEIEYMDGTVETFNSSDELFSIYRPLTTAEKTTNFGKAILISLLISIPLVLILVPIVTRLMFY